ncbi:hypothetical protein [Fructobacillus ficulneus]|uniref:RibT protein, riboflavin biosynthesis acetyltransferase (GNAT) family n=1 Tax=Fructobacillus ficulneus TaxID=157463 RepID=A0A0K8MJ88_9LACO|nr:hypothetical protein [Fructobacillus ficulneus]GAP00249.1 RibT protein, riboflavin biosynthesis acetyltransferase (GNAT) family [Fructobacillus ficulneus]
MLIPTRSDDEKTVMGLFSLVPELKDLAHLNLVLSLYNRESFHLLFWQPAGQDDVKGLIGYQDYNDEVIVVRHLIVTPGAPKKATNAQILTELQERFPEKVVMGSLDTQTNIDKWRKHYSKPKSYN